MTKKIFLACLGLALLPLTGYAASVKLSNYSEVLVKNLQIGQAYNMTQLVNLPLKLGNDTDQTMLVELTTEVPQGKQVKKGFEPIPAASWVTFGAQQVTVTAKSIAETDVFIKIPDDKKYLGKSFHAVIYARALPPKKMFIGFSPRIEGRLLFTIAPVKMNVPAPVADLKFEVNPTRVEVVDVVLGKKTPVLALEQKPVLVANASKEDKKFMVVSLDPKDTVLAIDPGSVACPQPDFLTVEKEEITVPAGKSEPLHMSVLIPDKPEYRGKRFEFIVSVEMGERGLTQRYLRVFVETKK